MWIYEINTNQERPDIDTYYKYIIPFYLKN